MPTTRRGAYAVGSAAVLLAWRSASASWRHSTAGFGAERPGVDGQLHWGIERAVDDEQHGAVVVVGRYGVDERHLAEPLRLVVRRVDR